MRPVSWLFVVIALALTNSSCEGPEGPTGQAGPPGPTGGTGTPGAPGVVPCLTTGLSTKVSVSAAPAGRTYFAAGESPVVTIQVLNGCNAPVPVSTLGTANLYLYGPRAAVQTKTASKLLNCVVDRAAADRQHHFINLLSPKFQDQNQNNLTQDPDGTVHFKLAPITSELPGTYTVGLWAKSKDEATQMFPLADFQLGTGTVEPYSSGPGATSTCAACHQLDASGKMYMHHIVPGFSPLGNFSLDQYPVATCKACHNADGYSANTTVRKIHGAHRGEHQRAPGVAHPEYGMPADTTMTAFLNVGFPVMTEQEKDCARCHTDDRWQTAPSRLGCGTCHDSVFFDTGVLNPPRALPKTCVADADCATFSQLATCNAAKACEINRHPRQTDDAQCVTCHTVDPTGLLPIAASHELISRTRIRGLQLKNVVVSGGSGQNGTVLVNDTLTVKFQLFDAKGAAVTDLKTTGTLSATAIIAGPNQDRQLVIPSTNLKSAGTLTYDGASSTYTYVYATPWPARSTAPLNNPAGAVRDNPPGSYGLYLYVAETLTVNGAQVRDAAPIVVNFRVGDPNLPLQARHVVTDAACNACHVSVQAHGGSRKNVEGCSTCHTQGAMDRTVGAVGVACTTDANCRSWERCQPSGAAKACIIVQDPTPNQTIRLSAMVHQIHYARLRDGYAERNNLIAPGKLNIIGFQNSVNDFSEILFPLDVRNCQKCHADSGARCSATAPCGIGQACVGSVCKNVAYLAPSTQVCLACHDSSAAAGHAAINTWKDPDGNSIETCNVCHGTGGDFSVSKVHNVVSPYVPPYDREKTGG